MANDNGGVLARSCIICTTEFVPRTSRHLMCSPRCRRKHYIAERSKRRTREYVCGECRRTFTADDLRPHPYCGLSCAATIAGRALQAQRRAARPRWLPIIHPNPDHVTHLPAKHPARRKPRPNPSWRNWKFFIAGTCEWCEEYFVAPSSGGQATKFCDRKCREASNEARYGRFIVPPKKRLAIYERDGWTCQLCSDPVDPSARLLP